MPLERTQKSVADTWRTTFAEVDVYFDRPADFRRHRPAKGGWTADEILAHITLTNRFLMLTLHKNGSPSPSKGRARRRHPRRRKRPREARSHRQARQLRLAPPRPHDADREPTSAEVRTLLRQQLAECLAQLERLRGSAGALCRVTMTVNDLRKVDLYRWLYFIAQHARRHLPQVAATEAGSQR